MRETLDLWSSELNDPAYETLLRHWDVDITSLDLTRPERITADGLLVFSSYYGYSGVGRLETWIHGIDAISETSWVLLCFIFHLFFRYLHLLDIWRYDIWFTVEYIGECDTEPAVGELQMEIIKLNCECDLIQVYHYSLIRLAFHKSLIIFCYYWVS